MQEIEMSNRMLERRDQIDNATYQLFQELLDATDEEVEELYPWDIADIEFLQGYAISILNRKGHYICNPSITTRENRQCRCTLTECYCRECKYQNEFMEKERILGSIEESLEHEGLEILGITEDSILFRENTTKSDFKLSIEVISRKEQENERK